MKSATIDAAMLASAAMAQPHGHHRRHQHHHDKRELVVEWTTEIETVTVVVDETGAETIYPSKTAAAVATPSSSGSPGEFFQAPSSKSSSSASVASSTSIVVAPSPSSTQQAPSPQPTTSTSTTPVVVPTITSVPAPVQPTTTAAAPPASTTAASSSGGSSGSGTASSKSGKMTYYQVGMGSCGYDDSGADGSKNIVAMGHTFWSSISTLTSYGVNQPANPLCDQQITIKASNGNSAVGVIRDMCPGCDGEGIDVSEKLFKELMGGTDAGKVDVTWSFNSGKW